MKLYLGLAVLLVGVVGLGIANAVAAPCDTPKKEIKMATLAPQGTSLHKGLMGVRDGIKQRTEGCLDVKIYAGGTAGDEKDVVRKMRAGQLNGAALTGVGLGMIEPEIRVLELPFLFSNQTQIDKTYAEMKPYFVDKFKQKGFELLGWAEVGFVQIFCREQPIKGRKDLEGKKMWMWEGDPLAQAMYESLKVVPVPLAITDVLTSLQTGLIDCAYAPPLGAIAFQWHTKSKHVTKVDLVNGTGGLIIADTFWKTLTPAEQEAVGSVISTEAQKLTSQSRADNAQSMQVLASSGLQIAELTPESKTELQAISKEVQQKLIGKLYPETLLTRVIAIAQ